MPACATNKCLEIIVSRIKGLGTEPLYIGWGTGAGVASPTSTTLSTEASEARVAGISQIITIENANDTYKVTGVLTADGAKTITNWALFDASVDGNLIAIESVSPGHALTPGQMLTFVFRFQIARQS